MDRALIRPGRVDVNQYIGYLTEYQAYKMFLNFYPNSNENLAKSFATTLISLKKNLSPAQVQGYFMLYKNQPNLALENIKHFNEQTVF